LLGGECSLESNFVSLVPLRSFKGLKCIANMFEPSRKVTNIFVVKMKSVLGIFDTIL